LKKLAGRRWDACFFTDDLRPLSVNMRAILENTEAALPPDALLSATRCANISSSLPLPPNAPAPDGASRPSLSCTLRLVICRALMASSSSARVNSGLLRSAVINSEFWYSCAMR